MYYYICITVLLYVLLYYYILQYNREIQNNYIDYNFCKKFEKLSEAKKFYTIYSVIQIKHITVFNK